MGSVTSGALSHIREGNADIAQERYTWDEAEMPSPGISLLKIFFFSLGNDQNPNPRCV